MACNGGEGRAVGADGQGPRIQAQPGNDLGPVEDLTSRAQLFSPGDASPFDGEQQYEDVFEALTRALYRRAAHIALVGDRGVGQDLLLAELARRAAFGQYRTLHDRRFVLVDCRYTAPQHSASRLTAILKLTCERPDVIVCVHGFA